MKPKPLSGIPVLVGRAKHQASALSTGLRRQGASIIELPFIEIRKPESYKPLDSALKNFGQYDWLILTSVNGVDALFARVKTLRLSKQSLHRLKIAAIGPATKKAIEKRGLKVHVVPKQYVAESVVASLRTKTRGKRVLLARAKVARDVIPTELRKTGAKVDVVEAYETVVPKSSKARLPVLLKKRRPSVITFTSSSTVKNFFALAGKGSAKLFVGIVFASIGPVTSATLRDLGLPVHIEAGKFTIPGLIRAIVAYFAHLRS